MTLLGVLPYPWHRPEARALHDLLLTLHPSAQAALLFAKTAGVDTTYILEAQPVAFLWKDVLEAAATSYRLEPLLRAVHDRLTEDHPARGFLGQVLDDRTPPTSGDAPGPTSGPTFLRRDDTVTEPEAMLFRDDLTLPIGRVPALIRTLERVLEAAPAVCKLTVMIAGEERYGTGFRVGDEHLLTNWHVVHRRKDGATASAVTAEFGFEDDGHGGLLPPRPVRCQPVPLATDREDDWAVLLAVEPLGDVPVLDPADAAVPTVASAAYVVQHPLGGRKRLGFVRNQVSYVDDRVVHYLTDTDAGSSGSPVLDADGRLIALHARGGRPQDVLGKPPLRKNEGTRISRVRMP